MTSLIELRRTIRDLHLADETQILSDLQSQSAIPEAVKQAAAGRACKLVTDIRTSGETGMMEVFMAEYGLSTDEGIALMCLAEALLRVPDSETVDALIEDKIAPSDWGSHLGKSSSSLVNASTWALMLTGKVLHDEEPGIAATLKSAVRRLGEPVIRTAVSRAMRELGAQFVLGQTIKEAVSRGSAKARKGFTYSYDMLGEAALTANDAEKFYDSYADAITQLAKHCKSDDIRENPGISIKLSALHPRYEVGQSDRVMRELTASTKRLARMARKAGMGFNIDAEEADRLDLSLDVIEAVLRDPDLAGWDGFGVVVQAFGKRCSAVLDWLYQLSSDLDRKIMVRLVKGAYWDTEIKRAQVEGTEGFPVFTRKVATDVAYICNSQKLLGMTDRIYPQFATHNAHTVAAILEMATDKTNFEFQRLHGMGEALHDIVLKNEGTRCRIYAPVGAHRDLLAYLVRRLLENGANSSFVNQIIDETVPPAEVAADPFAALETTPHSPVALPVDIFAPRKNSRGWDLHDLDDLGEIDTARTPFQSHQWQAKPLLVAEVVGREMIDVINPARPEDTVGHVLQANSEDAKTAIANAKVWDVPASERASALRKAADLYEENFGEFFAVLTREAGKTPMDAIAELREAVDFLRYYADEAERLAPTDPRGIFTCISPWNFPLAIFSGQIAAALAAGNAVLAKPAEPTSLTAFVAVTLMHRAGVPQSALQLLPGRGRDIGAALTGSPQINGTCFTGSTATAQTINKSLAEHASPDAPLIAETGGLNAMIVDSTALPEQAVRDIIASGFQSAGQRCSALRVLYVQEDVAEPFFEMLFGAMDELVLGNPWEYATDVGPVINEGAAKGIRDHIAAARKEGRVLKELRTPDSGTFVAPTVIRVDGIKDLEQEIFGPVIHVATYRADQLDTIVDDINDTGFGLTFGMHSRIDDRIDQVTARLNVGNMYINRNQIGAIVGSQPFGGEGLSGTGPKAGGPNYVKRFTATAAQHIAAETGAAADEQSVQNALDTMNAIRRPRLSSELLPGPTGESNQLSTFGRGTVLCLGPTPEAAAEQARIARQNGCAALEVAPEVSNGVGGTLSPDALRRLSGFDIVALWSTSDDQTAARRALAARNGRLIPLVTGDDLAEHCILERHICIDTTAAGGNAALLASVEG
ncbi:bifunctional proline dehydrogenase/L-glutamate gamma-semialdehyde dehydrogenase PutA [Neptunicoccus cionae]|uniref:Bifunctional protein PutA n=1 Tax=Neptunicoccus cionae TaxID=2035344 RepID=A0A916QRC9_9RHOB|nr:bifunctional proline dehydrogenase/L-glutamate gamma-semialdehyde dehydrogenase PutA [Amylibacter cionae]GGA05821.1 bifunctional protein PutA [Amylibacter cionae]